MTLLPYSSYSSPEPSIDVENSRLSTDIGMILFTQSRDIILVIRFRDGRIVEANPAAERAYGYTRAELLHCFISDLRAPVTHTRIGSQMQQVHKSGILFETLHRRKDGSVFPVEVSSSGTEFGAERANISIIRDTSERKMTEQALVASEEGYSKKVSRQLGRLSALQAIDQSILTAKDLEQTLVILLEKITGTLEVDGANLFLFDPKLKTLKTAATLGLPADFFWPASMPMAETLAGKVALSRKIEFIPDLSQYQHRLTERVEQISKQFTSFLAVPVEAKGELKGVLQLFHRTQLNPDEDWFGFLRALTDQAAIAIDNAQLLQAIKQTNEELIAAYDRTIEGWARALDLRDKETEGHSRRVTELTQLLGKRMGIAAQESIYLKWGALLHDIGKMGVKDEILLKPGKLDDEEWQVMRKHPVVGADLLYPISFLGTAIEIPYSHHEKWDGSGYPQGLRGAEIPFSARIFAVVDVWDALTHDRPYRKAWSKDKALANIQEQSGQHFDPGVVQEFMLLMQEDKELMAYPQG